MSFVVVVVVVSLFVCLFLFFYINLFFNEETEYESHYLVKESGKNPLDPLSAVGDDTINVFSQKKKTLNNYFNQ